MAATRVNRLLRHVRRLLEGPCPAAPDGLLLERFARHRDEEAFAALMHRYGPLVLGVARRVLGHEQDAEDVFQATFLILARKGGTIRKRASVGSWLFGVAHRLALRARADNARRSQRERQAAGETAAEPSAYVAWTCRRSWLAP